MKQAFDCRLIYDSGEANFIDITRDDLIFELNKRGIEFIESQNSDVPILILKETPKPGE